MTSNLWINKVGAELKYGTLGTDSDTVVNRGELNTATSGLQTQINANSTSIDRRAKINYSSSFPNDTGGDLYMAQGVTGRG